VRIFDLDGRCVHEMHGHTGNVLSLAWSQDGRHVVSSSVDGSIRMWDAELGIQIRATELQVRTDSVEIARDGVVYAGDDRGRIAIIDGDNVRYVQAHRAGVKKIALDERQGLIISLSYDRTMAVWRLGSDAEGHRLTEAGRSALPETIWARAATMLADGRIAVGTFGTTYATFDLKSSRWDLQGVAAGAAINAVLKVDARVYTVGDDGIVRVDGQAVAQTGSLCNFLVASENRVFTGGQLGQLFDASTGTVLHEHHSPLNCGVAFARYGAPHIAIGTYTGEILVFALGRDGTLRLSAKLDTYENAVKGLSVSDGLLFSVCASTDIVWHRIEDWSVVRRVDKAHERIANACCSLGRGRFASVGRDRQLRLWGSDSSEVYASPHPNSVKCMSVDDEHRSVLTGSYGGTLALFDLAERRWSAVSRPTQAGISSISWDRAQRRFLAASYDGKVYPVPV
jgi:WD40 repeat protein